LAEKKVPGLKALIERTYTAEESEANTAFIRQKAQARMTGCAAHIRNLEDMKDYEQELKEQMLDFARNTRWHRPAQIANMLRTRDILETQRALLNAMIAAGENFGSRGSAMLQVKEGVPVSEKLGAYTYQPHKETDNLVLLTRKEEGVYVSRTVPVRPLPEPDNWFENVWARYRKQRETFPKA